MRWLLVLVIACHDGHVTKLEQIRALARPIAFADVTRVLGEPVGDIGSGIHIYEYTLDDGRTLRVGTPDRKRVMYIHIVGDGDVYRE
jgi:hypothetical protein